MRTTSQAVVVGYDGSPDSHRALGWAADAARRQSRSLLVLVATGDLSWLSPHDRWLLLGSASDLKVEALQLAATYRVPEVTAQVGEGKAGPALLEVADEAAMVVVGARGHSLLAGTLTGSVSQHLAHHAPCTVVVVRAPHEPEATRIVVGVDGSPGGEKALQFAFDEASVMRAPLTAVHAFPRLASAARFGGDYLPLTLREEMEAGERVLAEAVVGWHEKYPEVEFSTQAIPKHPRHALADASEHAALLVVGSHGHGAFSRLLPGSVTQATLHHARCPVAIVR